MLIRHIATNAAPAAHVRFFSHTGARLHGEFAGMERRFVEIPARREG
jgi:hypothetical protein